MNQNESSTEKQHITHLEIKNFSCFKDFELKNVKRINLVFGKNGTGKTWLLRAIDLLANDAHNKDKNSQRDEIHDLDLAMFCILKEIENFDSDKPMRISEVLSRLGYFGEKEISIRDDGFQSIDQKRFSKLFKKSRFFSDRVFDEPFYRRRFGLPQGIYSKHMLYVGGDDMWKVRAEFLSETLSNSDKKEQALREKIIKNFVPNLKTTKPHARNGLNIFEEGRDENPLPLGYFGYGFKRAVLMYFFCMINENSIFGVDEFENGLHFDKQNMVSKTIIEASKSYNTQLFLTSHSKECSLNFLEEIQKSEQHTDFSGVYLNKDEQGNIVPLQMDFEKTKRFVERDENNINRIV